MDREAWRVVVHGVTTPRTELRDMSFKHLSASLSPIKQGLPLRKQRKSNQQGNFCLSERQFSSLTIWKIEGLGENISDSSITGKLPKVVFKIAYTLFCTAPHSVK